MRSPRALHPANQFAAADLSSADREPPALGETTGSSFLPLEGGTIHVRQDGPPAAPALLLIHGLAASTRWWDRLVPLLAGSYRVIRLDLLGHGQSAKPAGRGYDIPAHGRRVGAVLDRLGVTRAVVVGHSTGGAVATALAEHRRDLVRALALIDACPSLDADVSPGLLSRLLPVPIVGHGLWRLLTGPLTRTAMATGFARGFEVPQPLVDDVRGLPYHAFVATSHGAIAYLEQRSLPDRLAARRAPLLVLFGTADRRCRPSSAASYRVVPGAQVEMLHGLGHSPMVEDPPRTAALLHAFAASMQHGEQHG